MERPRPQRTAKPKLNAEQRDRVRESITLSAFWIWAGFIIFGIAIIISIVTIQLGASSDELRAQGENMAYSPRKIDAARGNILSDDGRTLATSIPYYDLRMDFQTPQFDTELFNRELPALARSLSEYFGGRSPQEYEAYLRRGFREKKRYYSLASKKVDFIELGVIKEFPFISAGVRKSGFIAERSYRRIKPLGDIASRTIGFVNSDGVKLGIEGAYDDVLRGIEGLVFMEKVSGNFWIPTTSNLNVSPQDGMDVSTTIDVEIQDIAQSALWNRVKEVEADWGTVIVMEVETGHIKAISNVTRGKNGKMVEDYNYAIAQSQEPGSTFKLPVLLALLDDGGFSLNDIIDTEGGTVHIGKAKVVDIRRGGYGKISLREVFAQSSNIGMAKAINRAYEDDPARFVEYIEDLGLGRELGLQIPGEPRPTLKHPDIRKSGWDGTSLTMMSYGYALQLTPLQTLTFYNAVANNGRMVRPKLITSLGYDGVIEEEYPDEVIIDKLASDRAIADLRSALESVVNIGTAKSLKNPHFSVAAKTGTAQIAMGRGGYMTADGSRHYLASIAGYFPADRPKYSIMVAIKTFYRYGSSKAYYGGALSAPVFSEIAHGIYTASSDFVAPYSNDSDIAPTGHHRENASHKLMVNDSLSMPNVIGLEFQEAIDILEPQGYCVTFKGVGRVIKQDTLKGNKDIHLTLGL